MVVMSFVPFIDDDETESVEQHAPELGIEMIGMTRRDQANLARQIEIEEGDFAISSAFRGITDDGARDRTL